MAVLIGMNSNMRSADAIQVEMAEIKISTRLTDRLVAYGLGACVGVCVYDPFQRIAGLAHIVLPERPRSLGFEPNKREPMAGKFADTAIPALVEEACRGGAVQDHLRAVIAGGAHIFSVFGNSTTGATSRLEIGARNAAAVTAALGAFGIPILAEDIGGSHGRTLSIRACDGHVTIRPIGGAETQLASLGKSHEAAA